MLRDPIRKGRRRVIDGFEPAPPVGFRHVYRCQRCGRLVHTAEACDDVGRELILRAHRTLDCHRPLARPARTATG